MTGELEQRLQSLGTSLELPQAPDLVPAVLARLPDRRRRRPARRTLAIALAAVLLLAGGAMAAPPTRHAILEVLGLRGVAIERVPHPPQLPSPTVRTLGLGQPIALARARHAASFTALLPAGSATTYVSHDVAGGRISVVMGRVLIVEFRGTTTPFIVKIVGPGTKITSVRVNGGHGVYLSGAPHEVLFREQTGEFQTDRIRLAGNALVWEQGPLTLRIEGTRTLRRALAIARSLR